MSSSNITIRQAKPEDEERLAEIIVKAFGCSTLHYAREKRYGVLCGKTWQERKSDEIRNTLRRHPEVVWVAELNHVVVGFVTYVPHPELNMGEIGNNAVDPEYQGRGIGKMLYRKVLDIFREKGFDIAEVVTGLSDEYAPARSAYEAVGFEPLFRSIIYTMRLNTDDDK